MGVKEQLDFLKKYDGTFVADAEPPYPRIQDLANTALALGVVGLEDVLPALETLLNGGRDKEAMERLGRALLTLPYFEPKPLLDTVGTDVADTERIDVSQKVPDSPQTMPAVSQSETGLSWLEQGLCAQTDPEAFYVEKGGSTRDAKKVCVGCDVRGECLEYALAHDERFGVWGGLSERERRKLKKHTV